MLIVQKFGGTSVADMERLENVATCVRRTREAGHQVVVVLSAAAGETDGLLNYAKKLSTDASPREVAQLVTVGEQKQIASLALILNREGIPATSLIASQVPIVTNGNFDQARIIWIGTEKIKSLLHQGHVAVIAGFQGVSESGDPTTLGRGGSDTTAVAVAKALHANICEIYTDVEGVYSADPRIVTEAKPLKRITYEEMLEMADTGAKVLQTRSVELAAIYKVPLKVKSSFVKGEGTQVVGEEKLAQGPMTSEESLEKFLISGISFNTDEAKLSVRRIPHGVDPLALIFEPLARAGINVDMIVENLGSDGTMDVAFTVSKADLKAAMKFAEASAKKLEAAKVEVAADIAKVSVVGLGMRTHAGVAHRVFQVVSELGIPIEMVTTSEIKISIVVKRQGAEKVVQVLHKVFGLQGVT